MWEVDIIFICICNPTDWKKGLIYTRWWINVYWMNEWVLLYWCGRQNKASPKDVYILIPRTFKLFQGHLGGSVGWTSNSWFWLRSWFQRHGLELCVRLHAEYGACLSFSLSVPLPLPSSHMHTDSLSLKYICISCSFTWQKGLWRCDYIKNLEMEKLSWIIWAGPR